MGKSVKESLIQVENLEYTAYGTNIKARLIYGWRLFMIGLTIINFTTCVIACVCAGYCYHKINVINSVTPSSPPPSSSSGAASATAEALAASVITTAAPIIPGHEHEHFKEYVVIDDDYLEYYDSDDGDDDYYDSSDDDDYSDGDDDYSDDDDDNSDNIDDDDNDYQDNEHDDYNGDNDDDNDDDSANIPNDSLMSTDASGDGNRDLENDTELDDSSQTTQSNKRSKRSTGTEKKCQSKCQKRKENERAKCVQKCIKRSQNKQKGKARPKPVQIQLQAAHFEASMSDAEVQNSVGGQYNQFGRTELCKYLDKLEGTLCLNRTFIPKKSHEPLRIFSKSSWYDEERSPVTFDNSIATVKSSGIFLVYAQAYIGGRSTSKSIMLVHKRNNNIIGSLRCVNGVNTDNDSTQQQSCSITGLMNLESSDTLEVQTSTPTEHITLNNHMTYFGLVQVSKFDTSSEDQTSKKRHN